MPPGYYFGNMDVNIPSPVPARGLNSKNFFEDSSASVGTLYRHCKTKDLPRIGSTIRLGTLAEFRTNENAAVRDKDEGLFRVSLTFASDTNVDCDKLKRLTLGTAPEVAGFHDSNLTTQVFAGNFTTAAIHCTDDDLFIGQSAMNVDANVPQQKFISLRGTINIMAESADAYLLCFSRSNRPKSVIMDSAYDAMWTLPAGNISQFANKMVVLLAEVLKQGGCLSDKTIGPLNAPGIAAPPVGDGFFPAVEVSIAAVQYRDKEMLLSRDLTEDLISEVHERIDNSPIIKPRAFEHEDEVRMIFRPVMIEKATGNCYLFPNYLNPQFILADRLMELVEVPH